MCFWCMLFTPRHCVLLTLESCQRSSTIQSKFCVQKTYMTTFDHSVFLFTASSKAFGSLQTFDDAVDGIWTESLSGDSKADRETVNVHDLGDQ